MVNYDQWEPPIKKVEQHPVLISGKETFKVKISTMWKIRASNLNPAEKFLYGGL